MYINGREERKNIFQDTEKMYKSNEKLVASIEHSKKGQFILLETEKLENVTAKRFDTPAKVIVSKKRSLEASKEYIGNHIGVLNFASATNPGGGVVNGSSAQEEALCRCSTLYPCISDYVVVNNFHYRHRELLKTDKMSVLYNDDCIYTPNVTVFKTDTASPKLMNEKDWFQVDIITCAAPNLRAKPSSSMNENAGTKAAKIKPNELLNLHMKRTKRILDLAKSKEIDVMILGAFGCGAFQNPPDIVSEAIARVVKEYLYDFKVIEFAVYCTPRDTKNYDSFNCRLSKIGK